MGKSTASTSKLSKTKNGPSVTAKAYLIGYNFAQTVGWSVVLYLLITYYLTQSKELLYERVKWWLIIFQNAAVLEVVHAASGIVHSNPVITALQVSSRVIVVCGVLIATQLARETVGLPLALFAWSVTEVIRYANYTLSLVDMVPYFIKWLRYTTFIVLYPIGVTGELLCIYNAQLEVKKTQLLTITMPNPLNMIFNYQYALIFLMFLYIPLFPQMYLHMFAQRRKVVGPPSAKKEK